MRGRIEKNNKRSPGNVKEAKRFFTKLNEYSACRLRINIGRTMSLKRRGKGINVLGN